jgi:serine/threonine protein kinase
VVESLVGCEVGQYRVLVELARGQHSVVYKAWQASLERHVALKVLHHYDQETLRKFQDEARLTAQLIQQGVPHIRRVYEVGQTADGTLFVALEYIDDSLQNVLRRARERSQPMNPRAAARLLEPIAQALDAIHRLGWVHLDIKPQNILIAKGGRAVLADFGIAHRCGMQTHACTPAYASPEQAAGDRPVGPWSDVYSLGVVLYEMIAGHPPVRGDHDFVLLNQHLTVTPPSPRRVNPRLSPAQERALYRALSKLPEERFRTATELVQAMSVQGTFFSRMVSAPRRLDSSAKRPGRVLLWVVAGGVLLLALLLLLTWAVWPGLGGREAATGTVPVGVDIPPATASPNELAPALPSPAGRASATAARGPVATARPTVAPPPTVTLAPTPTQRPRPTITPSPIATPTTTACLCSPQGGSGGSGWRPRSSSRSTRATSVALCPRMGYNAVTAEADANSRMRTGAWATRG